MEDIKSRISQFYKSFSGTDTLAFIIIPGCTPVWLGSLTTISYSVYRNKRPVINIGRTNINGVTRGSRIYAGTMIFTLINQHWLREVQEQEAVSWLADFPDLKADELPLFDIAIVSANEYGNAVTMFIYGIDFTDEAQTISVEDLFIENTFSFVARDISTFKAMNVLLQKTEHYSSYEKPDDRTQRYYIIDHSKFSFEQLDELEKEYRLSKVEFNSKQDKLHSLQREPYYPASKPFIGNDIMNVQQMLNATKLFDLTVNGIYDEETAQAVKEYQYSVNLPPTGVLNQKTYNALLNNVQADTSARLATVINKYGAYIYRNPMLTSDIVGTVSYQSNIAVLELLTIEDGGIERKWYKIEQGYALASDMYSSYYHASVIEFPVLQYGDTSVHTTIMQSALSKIYPTFTGITGVFDYATLVALKQFQADRGLEITGVVDYQTWLLLEQYGRDVITQITDNNFNITMTRDPGTYEIRKSEILQQLREFSVTLSCDNPIRVKLTATCIYSQGAKKSKQEVAKSQVYTIQDAQILNFDTLFRNAFVYNPQTGQLPDVVDIVVYPFNKQPYKWSIKYV